MQPRIISAACKATVNGEKNVFPCHRHCDFYLWMKYLHCTYDKNEVETGFIAWDGVQERFVNRHEAAQIALAANQIISEDFDSETLYSEDLW